MAHLWERIIGYAPRGQLLLCCILSVLIPVVVERANRLLHKVNDPPWLKEDRQQEKNNAESDQA
ncbi:hypothetical protein [Paenibacillus gansuensis]|uniref:Uncharacterized protein n=1 Tax=Paenibacillus gansuensis TaxID=306542 RepID=A0ABW5PCK2_9BACL